MRVFVTGGTGTIGEAVIKELRRAGHAVRGLSRSDASDAKLRALGATPHRGALDQSASYQRSAAAHDALLHIAFDYGNAIATDRVAIEALLAAGKGRRLYLGRAGHGQHRYARRRVGLDGGRNPDDRLAPGARALDARSGQRRNHHRGDPAGLRLRRHRDWLHQASGMFVHAGYPTLEAVNRAEAQLYTIVNQQSSLLSISTAVSVWWCQAWLRRPWRCVSRISNPPQKPTGAH